MQRALRSTSNFDQLETTVQLASRADRTDSAHTIELRDFQLQTAGDNNDQLVQELRQFQLQTAGDNDDQLTQELRQFQVRIDGDNNDQLTQ